MVLWEKTLDCFKGYCVAFLTPEVSRALHSAKVCVQPLSHSALQRGLSQSLRTIRGSEEAVL